MIISIKNLLSSESGLTAAGDNKKDIQYIFALTYLMGGSSSDFFDFYQKNLSGVAKEFRLSVSVGFGLSYNITDNSSLILLSEINRGYMNDNYDEIITTGHSGARNITQNFSVLNIPITLNFKFHPVLTNYFSYVMVGFGVAHSHIKWDESVYSSIKDDIRKGGTHYDKEKIVPAFRFSSGIELEFDNKTEKYFLNSFFFEFCFNYFFRNADIFSKVRKQFFQQEEGFIKTYTILPFYFGLNFGIKYNLNFVN